MNILLDTNILTRLAEPGHVMHQAALDATASLRMQGDTLCIVPQNLYEFWVVATRPVSANGLGKTAAEATAELANLKTIIGRFSDFARMPPPERQPMSLNDTVREVTQLFRAQFQSAGVKLEEYLEEKLPLVSADAGQWSRALRNLVLNAMDAMPAGGVLKIRTEAHDRLVRLEISDTGSGLTKEECERLFTPYYTTKQHGTGLGLAIVQSVVSDHGGRISVESEVGQGTRFRVELDVA